MGVIRGGGYFVPKILRQTGCTRIFGVPDTLRAREPGRDSEVLAGTT